MNYSETLHFLFYELPMFSREGMGAYKKDLQRVKLLCEALGHPEKKFKSIHVGGTNGKGSVCHMLSAVFQQSGYKVGLHTSPHLIDFRERLRINGELASEDFVISFVEENRSLVKEIKPSYFEFSVAMAFTWFAINQVDLAVVEVGLGGRLDSTNIIRPMLSVITNIGLDHTEILGDTRAKIAGEKAGIIKLHTPVIIGQKDQETSPVFEKKAKSNYAPLVYAEDALTVNEISRNIHDQTFELIERRSKEKRELKIDLQGVYQLQNLRTVWVALDQLEELGWKIPLKHRITAFKNVKTLTGLRGRWEVLQEDPLTVVDVGHNVEGVRQIMRQLASASYKQLFIVTGFVKDKDVEGILRLYPRHATYFFCQAESPRSLPATELKQRADRKGLEGGAYSSVRSAYEAAKLKAREGDLILVCGSTFVVADLLAGIEA